MKPVFGYMRVSGKGQVQVQEDGFPRQKKVIEQYCKQHALTLVKIYREEGVSGEDLDRPAWGEMLTALLADGVRTVVIERLDRLARKLLVQEALIQDLQKRGFELISIAEPDLCSDDDDRVLLRHIIGAIAQHDKNVLVKRLRVARIRAREKTGRCEGRKPFGFRKSEQTTLANMREWSAQGMSAGKIAGRLNEAKVLPREGMAWYDCTVRRILERKVN